jgi:hypothetical protein
MQAADLGWLSAGRQVLVLLREARLPPDRSHSLSAPPPRAAVAQVGWRNLQMAPVRWQRDRSGWVADGALPLAVGVAFDDEFVAGGGEPVDGGLGE